jgi:hypothetical protein
MASSLAIAIKQYNGSIRVRSPQPISLFVCLLMQLWKIDEKLEMQLLFVQSRLPFFFLLATLHFFSSFSLCNWA